MRSMRNTRRKFLTALCLTTLAVAAAGCSKSKAANETTASVETNATIESSEVVTTTLAGYENILDKNKETKASSVEETSGEGKIDKETTAAKEDPSAAASSSTVEVTTSKAIAPSDAASATTTATTSTTETTKASVATTTAAATETKPVSETKATVAETTAAAKPTQAAQPTTTAPAPTEAPTPAPTVHEHNYTSAVTKNPTCTETGVMTFSCACGSSYTEAIGATGHNYEWSVVTDSTCFTEGLYVVGCLNCGDYYNEVMPMKDHIFNEYYFNYDATMESDGTETSRCSRNIYCRATDTRVKLGSKLTEPPLPHWDGPEGGIAYDNGDGTYTMYVCVDNAGDVAAHNSFCLDGHRVIEREYLGEYFEGKFEKQIFN